MTSHKHSFQCFDAVVEKPDLTAENNFALPHSCDCTSIRLEQLKHRRCSLCSESQQVKTVTSEVIENQPASWYQSQSPGHQHTPRRPMRPKGDPVYSFAHRHRNHHHQYHTHSHRKRIVLIKNSNPSIQKAILLHRQPVHSLSVFMEDVSELMHCLIRKLYTLDGCKVDSVQSLLHGPSILVCVGHEPFHPLLLNSLQKNSEDKLPKLIFKSQSSKCNDDQRYKKNVNFGLKSKKDSPPGPFPKTRENLLDDNVEKRVLFSKDGSLSVEMKVRFRLLNDESLHCSTNIKKSSCTSNVCFPAQDNVYYSHCSHSESCSEAATPSANEAEDVYISKLLSQKHTEELHCQHCCTHCQEYDIWKCLRHIGSARNKCKKESFDVVHNTSCKEYTEHVVEKATCIQHTVGEGEEGDNTVQYSTISRCSSPSEACLVFTKKAGYTDNQDGKNESTHSFGDKQKNHVSSKNFKQELMSVQITQVSIEDERSVSVETNSSDILASLNEDGNKEESVLSPSNSRASQNYEENDEQMRSIVMSLCSFIPCNPQESPNHSLSTRTSSIASSCSVKPKTSRKFGVKEIQGNVLTTPHRCQHKQSTDVAIENGTTEEKLQAINQSEEILDENDVLEGDMRALKSESDLSKTSNISDETEETYSNSHTYVTVSNSHVGEEKSGKVKDCTCKCIVRCTRGLTEENIEVTRLATPSDSDTPESSVATNKTAETVDVTYKKKKGSAISSQSNVSARSCQSGLSEVEYKERKKAELQKKEHVTSVHTHASTISKQSTVSELLANGEDLTEERMIRALSNLSRSSQLLNLDMSEFEEIEYQREYSSPSIISVKSSISEGGPVKLGKVQSAESLSALSTKTNVSDRSMTSRISEGTSADIDNRPLIERVPSTMSVKSDISVSSKSSNILDISPYDSEAVEEVREDRASSANSNKASLRSNTLKLSTVVTDKSNVVDVERLKRPSSVISSKSSASVRSTNSKLRHENENSTAEKAEQFIDKCISSVLPSNPRDSELSKNCKTSEDMLEKSADFEANLEEQSPRSRSTKFNALRKSEKLESETLETGIEKKEERPLSTMSSKSIVSIKSEKFKILEAKLECGHPEERPATVMSNISVKSKTSTVSDATCEEESKQTGRRSQNALSVRSRKSKAPGASRQDTGNEGNRERTPSVMSCKSSHSDRPNLVPDEVANPGATEDLLKQTESAYEDIKDGRTVSALSSKSQMSYLSIKSKDLSQERTPTSMSVKSNVSTKSSTRKVERASILASHVSNTPAINAKKYLADVSPADLEHQSTERNLSAMSGKSKSSETSNKNYFKEPIYAYKEELVERSPSAMSAKSNTTVRSKSSDAQSMENIAQSSTFAKNENSNCSIINGDTVKSVKTWDIKREGSDMTEKSSKAAKSDILSLALTDNVGLNKRSQSAMSGLKILMTETSNNVDIKDRASSALSNKSNSSSVHPTSESVLSRASASVSIGIVEDYDYNNEEDSSLSFISEKSPQLNSPIEIGNQQHIHTPEARAESSLTEGTIVSDKSKKSKCNHKNSPQPVKGNEVANNTTAKKNSKKSSSRSLSSRPAHSDFGLAKTKVPPELSANPKMNTTNTPLYLKVNGQKSNATARFKSAGKRSKSNLSSDRYSEKKEETARLHSADVPIGSVLRQKSKEPVLSLGVCDNSSPSHENGKKSNTTRDLNTCGRTCNGSLVATDTSRNIDDNKSEKNSLSSCRHSTSSLAQKRDNYPSELVPSTLPSSSPTEVVNEWLKKIPLDSALYDVEDEFHVNCEEEELLAGNVTQYESGNRNERDSSAAVLRQENDEEVEEVMDNKSKLGDLKETDKDPTVVENIQPCTFPDVPSSVHLMKILLSSKLERCKSLPEVSPAYGRKLSMSAKEFLDSLVNLQLLDFDTNDVNGKAKKYNDLMNMLQSLWLCDHHDSVTISQRSKFDNQQTFEEEFKVKSFLEVPIDRRFQNSGKSSVNENTLAFKSQTHAQRESFEVLTKIQETVKTENGIETKFDSATPDIARRVQRTPMNEAEENMKENNVLSLVSDFTIRNDYSLREPTETASISNKSSGTDNIIQQKLMDHGQDTHLESLSSEQLSHLAENVSQDPDPVLVLNLLNNIEKQFMTHYVTAMAEFMVHWNLNNNEQLDVIINHSRDEVHKRIQASINNELKKFKAHVGRPKPSKESNSRETNTEQPEQIRRRRKVNLSQSINPAAKAKIIEKDKEEFCDDLAEGKGSVEGETVSKDLATVENMAVEAGTVKQEVGEREFTDGKGTEGETSDNKSEDETVKNKKISKDVSIEEGTIEDNQTAEEVTATESELEKTGEISDDEKAKHEDTSTDAELYEGEDETSEEDDTAEAEKSKCTDNEETHDNSEFSFEEKISEPAEDGDKTDQVSVEEDNLINTGSAEVRETDDDELDVEGNTTKAETIEDDESADSKTYEYRENLYKDSSDRTEIIKVTTITDDGEISDGDKAAGDDGASNAGKSEIAENRDRDDDEISEIEETAGTYNKINEAKTTEHEETHDDKISDEEETAGTVVKEDEDIAEVAEENGNDDDEDDDDNDDDDDDDDDDDERLPERVTEIVSGEAHKTNDVKQFVGDEMNIANVQKTEGGQNDSKETANGQVNNETSKDTEMDTSHSEETTDADIDQKAEDGTEEGGETPNDHTADDESTDDGQTSNNNMTDDTNPPGYDMEEDDRTTKAETAENVGEQEDDRRANGQISDDAIADDEATTGTENGEDEETAEAKTGEDRAIANNGKEDGDSADERDADDEELSENEIAQNGEIAETEDCNESLVTDGEVHGETNESNTDEDIINTDNIKTKPNSEILRVKVTTLSINTGESDEGKAEAEEDTEPIVETNTRVQGIKIPAMQPTERSPHKADIKMNSTVKMYPSSEDGGDADSEDSDTELHSEKK